MSFEETQGVLLEAQAEEVAPGQVESDDSDYVTQYMEQLLARNRSEAGESLPEELHKAAPATTKPDSASKKQPTSFIDQYMQTYPDETQTPAEDDASADQSATGEIPQPRRKIDRDALRQDMNSFREVSVQSVQKALESHAMRKELSGLAGRQAVTAVLVLMTMFVAAANVMGITEYPMLVWGLTFCSAAAAAELCRRIFAVRSRVREMTEHLAVSTNNSADENLPVVGAERNDEDHIGTAASPEAELSNETAIADAVSHIDDDAIASESEPATRDMAIEDEVLTPVDDESVELPTPAGEPAAMAFADEEEDKYYEL
jgi:hypothetical protein